MRQPEATKARILKQSGQLFNTQGYKATSISDITDATGLTKGAIYRHFKNKSHLEKEALGFLAESLFSNLRNRIKGEPTAPRKLKSIFRFFETYISQPPIKGGCPLLNVGPEVDDGQPVLRRQAVKVLDVLRESIRHVLTKGMEHGQLKPNLDTDYYASIFIATLEGAIMMSKLHGNNRDIRTAILHLEKMTDELTL
ncbi:MAG: TetR/AcrR family transcriptional regulator [Cyclobacteriaceae bacterium]|jgi:TetR/AcrR family transcriptional repressor of nem operon